MTDDFMFPHVKKKIDDFLYDEEGNIPINKVMTIGSMMLILGLLMADDAFAAHRSHSSHQSHSSHSSGSYGGGHSSHASHASHTSSYGGGGTDSTTSQIPAAHTSHNNVAPDKAIMGQIHQMGDADKINIDAAKDTIEEATEPPVTTGIDIKG